MSMFKALGNLATRQSTKESISPKARTSSSGQVPTNIARLVGLVRDGKIQTALEELARVGSDMNTICLMAEPINKSTLLHAAAEVGSEEVAKAVIAYTSTMGAVSPLIEAQDKQGKHDHHLGDFLPSPCFINIPIGFTAFHAAASAHQFAICDLLLEKVRSSFLKK